MEAHVFGDRRTPRRRQPSAPSSPDDARQSQIVELRATIDRQQEEISELELAVAQSSRVLRQTRQQLVRLLRESDGAARGRVERLIEMVGDGTPRRTSRRTFDEWLDQSKRTFIRRLSSRFPMLTPTQLKICSLLQLNLRTREIASLLHTSVRNIESHRYWIRKKLEIPGSTNLSTFLTGV
jgi:DNA-binding CsgD family transcriptional regulator